MKLDMQLRWQNSSLSYKSRWNVLSGPAAPIFAGQRLPCEGLERNARWGQKQRLSIIPAAVPMAGLVSLSFTPWQALVGGASIGTLSAGKTLVTGRILGISGTVKGLLAADFSSWRLLFISGLISGGLLASSLLPAPFEVLPASYSLARACMAGLLVGIGVTLGNGCTSGHGIAGNARLSLRSLANTAMFMATGMAAVALTGTLDALHVAPTPPPYALPSHDELVLGLSTLAASVIGTATFGFVAAKQKSTAVASIYELFSGTLFGLSLCLSGMTKPSAVASALAAFQPTWNLTLFFVMGGALVVALPMFQLLVLKCSESLCGLPMKCPTNNKLDAELLLGGALFGAGWGIGGFCPGPALVSLAFPQQQNIALVGCMLLGMVAANSYKGALSATKAKGRIA